MSEEFDIDAFISSIRVENAFDWPSSPADSEHLRDFDLNAYIASLPVDEDIAKGVGDDFDLDAYIASMPQEEGLEGGSEDSGSSEDSEESEEESDEESEEESEEESDEGSEEGTEALEDVLCEDCVVDDGIGVNQSWRFGIQHPQARKAKVGGFRRGADAMKKEALNAQFGDVVKQLSEPCNSSCFLSRRCASQVPVAICFQLRQKFFGDVGEPGPGDKERAHKIYEILKNDTFRDRDRNLVFKLEEYELCAAGYLRVLGLSSSTEISKAPGQFRRLMRGFLDGISQIDLLASAKIKLDVSEKSLPIRRLHWAFIDNLAAFFSDTVPVAKSQKGDAVVDIRQLPFRHLSDVYNEFVFQCQTANPPISKHIHGSYSTFKSVYKEMHSAKLVQLLGGKGGFQTCTICNHCQALKKSAASRRDRATVEIVRSLQRLHLVQEKIERQHCDNFILNCAKALNDFGEPEYWFVELDGMSRFKTVVPRLQKDRTDAAVAGAQVENRLIGARIVCGPIDKYIGITTGPLIPGGANPNIEATRLAIEQLALELAMLPTPLALPKKGGFNGDNCGDNKSKTMFAWFAHLVEDCYFDSVEMFFLIAGHTHSPIDQNFSVQGAAIARADFIGSKLAMAELFLAAHDVTKQKNKDARIQKVIEMETYHDYDEKYSAVINPLFKYHSGPHRYILQRHNVWGFVYLQYQWCSPKASWVNTWLPPKPGGAEDIAENEAVIDVVSLATFGGRSELLRGLNVNTNDKFDDLIVSSSARARSELSRRREVEAAMPHIQTMELSIIADNESRGSAEHLAGPTELTEVIIASRKSISAVEKAMLAQNTAKAGYILLLKRSLHDDPSWLDKRPTVLPNPKLWSRVVDSSDDVAMTEQPINGMIRDNRDSNTGDADEPDDPSARTRRPRRTPEEIAKEAAKTNLMRFNSGAAALAKCSKMMLEYKDLDRFGPVSTAAKVVDATRGFTMTALTQREVDFYHSTSTVAFVRRLQDGITERAETEPWKLLRLPTLSAETVQRWEDIKAEKLAALAKREANLRRLIQAVDHDPTAEVITREGREIIFNTNMEDMTLDQLKILVRNANIPGRTNIMKKKTTCIAAIREYLRRHPAESLRTLQGLEEPLLPVAAVQVDLPAQQISDDAVLGDTCSILECNSTPLVFCIACRLTFCIVMHGTHDGHCQMQLKDGFSFHRVSEETISAAPIDPEPSSSTIPTRPAAPQAVPVALRQPVHEPEAAPIVPIVPIAPNSPVAPVGHESTVIYPVTPCRPSRQINAQAAARGPRLPRHITDALTAPADDHDSAAAPAALARSHCALVVPRAARKRSQSEFAGTSQTGDNPPTRNLKRQPESNGHGSEGPGSRSLPSFVAEAIRALLQMRSKSNEAVEEAIIKKLDFLSYDVDFLVQLSKEFNVDLSPYISGRRVARKDVMMHLISHLTMN